MHYVIRFSKYVNVISFGTIDYIQANGADMISLMSGGRGTTIPKSNYIRLKGGSGNANTIYSIVLFKTIEW